MLSGITELNGEYKCSFCSGAWNKSSSEFAIWVLQMHDAAATGAPNTLQRSNTAAQSTEEILFNYTQYRQIQVPWHLT